MFLMMSQWMLYLSRAIDGAAAFLIGMAALEAAIRTSGLLIHRRLSPGSKEEVRLNLGLWLSLALEFEIAADIVRTAIAPGWGGRRLENSPPSWCCARCSTIFCRPN